MASERLGAAMSRWEAGDLDGAAVLFREIAAAGDPEASHLLACLLEDMGDLDGAEAAHRSVIQSGDPVFGQRSAIAMGMMLVTAREWPAAHRVLTIASDGADFEVAALADTALVLVQTELGDVAGAAESLERARRCDSPAVADLAARLELPEFVPEDPGTARELYELAETDDDYRALLTCGDPDIAALSAFRLYQTHADAGEYEAAREVCEHAIAVGHPGHLSMAHRLLGAVLVDLGEYSESVRSYARAAEDPRPEMRLPALVEQAKVTAQLGDMEEAKAIFRRVVVSGLREYAVEAQACLAQLHAEAGEVADALPALRAVLETGESEWSSISVTLLGMLLEQHPEHRESIMELVGEATGHHDSDTAFKAALLLDHEARRQPLADPVEEQALQDADDALRHLREGSIDEARRLLRQAADSGAGSQSIRAMVTLAQLELGEGDREQADELLAYVAEGDDLLQGFSATFLLHLLRHSDDSIDGLHPVLRAIVDHQRLGREEGLAAYRAAMDHPDPATSAIGAAVLGQVLASVGYELSDAAELFRTATGSGDPLALAYTAIVFKDALVQGDDVSEAVELLRRARAGGHPALAPWVAHALGELLAERDDDLSEARAAYTEALESGHPGLRTEAASALLQLFERQGDLLAACRLHERLVAEGEPGQAARSAWLLGLTRVRIDDLDGARTAFALVPEQDPEQGVLGRYARQLLDRDFHAAAEASAAIEDDGGAWLAAMLAMEAAHAWQRRADTAAADGSLSLVIEAGHEDFRQEAACYLAALRHGSGDETGAVSAWERAAEGPSPRLTAMAERNLGPAWHRLGRLDLAAEAYRLVLSTTRENAPPAPGDDRAPGEGGDPGDGAEGQEERAHRARAALGLAEVLVASGATDEARRLLQDVYGGTAPLHLARFLRDRDDLAGALAAAEEAVQAVPYTLAGEASCLLGSLLAGSGDLAGAREAFARAAATDPGSAGATLLEAGRALAEAGDDDGARSAYLRAATLDGPFGAAARVKLGTATAEERPWVLAAEGDVQGALDALTELTGSAPMAALLLALDTGDVPAVRRRLADAPSEDAFAETLEAARATEDDDLAESLYRLVAELGGPEWAARAGLGLGALAADAGRHSRAELCFLLATGSADPELSGPAWRNIAVVRQRCGDLDGAAGALRAALPGAAAQLATLLEERGDVPGAREVLERGAAGGDLACVRHLLIHLLEHQDHEACAELAERAVGTGDPETVAVGYWVWGDACKADGDVTGAVRMYRKGIDTGHAGTAPVMRADLAEALHALGDTAEAAQEARLAIESGHPDAVVRGGFRLGCWLHEEGDPLGAAEAFAAAASQEATESGLAGAALDNLGVLARQAYERGEHALAVDVLSHMGPRAAATARELGELCDDPAAVPGYYELTGPGPFTELAVADRLAELGHPDRAKAVYQGLNEHEDPDVRFVAGGRLLALLDSEGDSAAVYSLAERQAGDAESPVRPVFGSLLGMLQGRQGETEASLRTLRDAAGSGEPTALSVFAQALVGTGEVDEGRQTYLRVLEAGDAELAARAMVALGHTYHEEDETRAREWYVRAVESGQAHVSALGAMYLGALAKRDRDFPGALGWYQRVIDSGDSESALAAAHLGELCYWLGDRDGALRYYELTLGLTEQPGLVAEAAYRLGEIKYGHGDLATARRMLTMAVATDDSTFAPEAENLLAKLA